MVSQSKLPSIVISSSGSRKPTVSPCETKESSSPEELNILSKIADCEKVYLFGKNGKNGWRCMWCKTDWMSFNATKALHHLAQVSISGMVVSYHSPFFFAFINSSNHNLEMHCQNRSAEERTVPSPVQELC